MKEGKQGWAASSLRVTQIVNIYKYINMGHLTVRYKEFSLFA
jgi:hypothetical protein